MQESTHTEKKILKPAIIHDDLPPIKSSSHLVETITQGNLQPENPERHYHHDALTDLSPSNSGDQHDNELGREDG